MSVARETGPAITAREAAKQFDVLKPASSWANTGVEKRDRTYYPLNGIRIPLLPTGYPGGVFIGDDNFIGNKREVKKFLPELERWNREHGRSFQYGTEASLNLAEDPKLLKSIIAAGFLWIFIGIETPSTAALEEARKLQNVNSAATLLDRVRVLQNAGLLIFG